jgi:methionyl-tRNA formyltransferase
MPAAVLAARINGLFPWPTCAISVNGELVKIGLADVAGEVVGGQGKTGEIPGSVLGSDSAGLLLATGRGVLRLRRLQRAGGRMLDAGEFLRGYPISTGVRIESRPLAPLVAPAPFRR